MGRRQTRSPERIAALTQPSVSLHPEALEEAVAATEWYAKRSRRAAESFLDEIDRVIGAAFRKRDTSPIRIDIYNEIAVGVTIMRIRTLGVTNGKGQEEWKAREDLLQRCGQISHGQIGNRRPPRSVSYTHLTLPTIYSV